MVLLGLLSFLFGILPTGTEFFKNSDRIRSEKQPALSYRLPSTWTNVFHMTSTDNNCCNHGDRIPAVFVGKEKHFHITASVGGNGNFHHNYNFELNTLYHVKIKQEKMVGSTSGNFSIWINDEYILFKENDQLKNFDNVRLYLGDPWHSSFKSYGKLTDLKVTNLGMEKHYLEEKIVGYSFKSFFLNMTRN